MSNISMSLQSEANEFLLTIDSDGDIQCEIFSKIESGANHIIFTTPKRELAHLASMLALMSAFVRELDAKQPVPTSID